MSRIDSSKVARNASDYFSDADKKRLRTEFGVPARKADSFIKRSQTHVWVYDGLIRGSKPKELREPLQQIEAACKNLIGLSKTFMWPKGANRDALHMQVSHLFFQGASYQFQLSLGGEDEERLRNTPYLRIPPDFEGGLEQEDRRLLRLGRSFRVLARIEGKNDGRNFEEIVLGILLMLQEAAYSAKHMQTLKRGRPTASEDNWLGSQLVETYRKCTGKAPTKSRGGNFAKYLSLCLNAARDRRDVFPILEQILGKRKTRQEQRQGSEAMKAAAANQLAPWLQALMVEK